MRSANLKYNFGIDLDAYNELYKKQNKVCAICKTHETKNRLHVDHCHKTGKVRGLLCGRCNTALGSFQDNLKWLQAAIDYLI